jgi:ElaB/YqjD/DUF883 family membrane-anchored ribosome-binding protein
MARRQSAAPGDCGNYAYSRGVCSVTLRRTVTGVNSMQGAAERILGDLHNLVRELEESFKGSSATEALSEAGGQLKEGLSRAREKLEELETRVHGGVKRSAKATDAYVRNNPWRSVGIAAAAAFILGAIVSHHDSD